MTKLQLAIASQEASLESRAQGYLGNKMSAWINLIKAHMYLAAAKGCYQGAAAGTGEEK